MSRRPSPRVAIGALGLVTVVGYGACYYAFGVLIGPISDDTGWSQGALGAIFGAGLLVTGLLGVLGGRLLDRSGPRTVFALAGSLGAVALALASLQTRLVAFGSAYVIGCGVVGALGFYHVTQPAAARADPADPARAIVWLTIIGAFASPLYLPLTAWLVDAFGWRATIRIHAASVALAFLPAAAVLTLPGTAHGDAPRTGIRQAIRTAWASPGVRLWIIATLIGGAAVDVLLVYQVPILVAAGLSSATAASVAGARGFAQLGGRLPLGALLRRLGARWTLVLSHLVAAAAAALLLAGGRLTVAIAYSLLAGASIGAIYTLQGIYTRELVDPQHLGMLAGAQQAVFGVGGAAGPIAAGLVLQLTGAHWVLTLPTCAALLIAAAVLALRPAPATR